MEKCDSYFYKHSYGLKNNNKILQTFYLQKFNMMKILHIYLPYKK